MGTDATTMAGIISGKHRAYFKRTSSLETVMRDGDGAGKFRHDLMIWKWGIIDDIEKPICRESALPHY